MINSTIVEGYGSYEKFMGSLLHFRSLASASAFYRIEREKTTSISLGSEVQLRV